MNNGLKGAIIIAALILALGFVIGRCLPVYEIVSASGDRAYKINRLTGSVTFIAGDRGLPVVTQEPARR